MSQFELDLSVLKANRNFYTKCGDNAILSPLSANIAVEVILRNSFGEIWNRFVIMNRDDTCYGREGGNP